MAYRIAGIDVHKRVLAVVVADVDVAGEYVFERRQYGTHPAQLKELATWLAQQKVQEVVLESTAQYWKPLGGALEQYWQPICEQEGARPLSGSLHLAPAQSNRGRRGRKNDFADAERLVRRYVAAELTLSFVPEAEQRLWRRLMRTQYQLRCNQVRLQNRLEALLEEAHLKLSSLVSDLLGVSGRRRLQAIAEGATDPAAVATQADYRLRATPEQLCDALGACRDLHPVYRRLVKTALEDWERTEAQITRLGQEMATLLAAHQEEVERRAEVPGLGVDSAQPIIAEVGVGAATFPSSAALSCWAGACPGEEETAGVNHNRRSPQGNRHLRRILNQAANAAVKLKGSIFALLYRRYVVRFGHIKTIAVIAHRLCCLVWKILHQGVRYEERGPEVSKQAQQRRTARMIRQLRSLGYRIQMPNASQPTPA